MSGEALVVKVVADLIAAHEAYAAAPPKRIVLPERLFMALILSIQKQAMPWLPGGFQEPLGCVYVHGVEVVADDG